MVRVMMILYKTEKAPQGGGALYKRSGLIATDLWSLRLIIPEILKNEDWNRADWCRFR